MKTQQQYEDEAIGHSVTDDNCIGYATQRKRFRQDGMPRWIALIICRGTRPSRRSQNT